MSSKLIVNTIRHTGASSDAVTLASDGTFSGNITNRPNRNALINGGMQIAQRASSNSAINTYGPLDRWRTIGGPMGFTITQVTDATNYPNTHYALKAHRTAGNTQEYDLGVIQGIETANSRGFAGKQCTFSFRARVGANFSGPSSILKVILWTGTGTDDNPVGMTGQGGITVDKTVSTTATKYSVTYTLPSSVTQITCGVYYQCRGTAGANDWFEITDCQFELGSVSSDFEYRSFGQELALCQRYCVVDVTSRNWYNASGANVYDYQLISWPTTMRATPTITYGSNVEMTNVNTSGGVNGHGSAYVTTSGWNYSPLSNSTGNTTGRVNYTASCEL